MRRALVLALLWSLLGPDAGLRAEVVAPAVQGVQGPPVLELRCVPGSGLVDQPDTYTLIFQTADTIPVAGAFRITFPSGFDLAATSAEYRDTPRPDVPGIAAQFPDYESYRIYLDSTGTPAPAGTSLRIVLTDVHNPTRAASFSVALEILDADLATLYGPTLSDPFTLLPGAPVELQLVTHDADTVSAGATLEYAAQATDLYGNVVTPLAVAYGVEPDSLGFFTGSVFSARKTGTGKVVVTSGALADTSGLLRVDPGPLSVWEVAGLPASVVAGAAASAQPVVITARDEFGNRQYLYREELYFTTRDALATLPATLASPYVMSGADSGRASFPGPGFVWRTAGLDSLHVLGGGATASSPLSINAGTGVDFRLVAPDTVVAGTPFVLTVQNVKDRFGNAADGLVTLFTNSADSLAPGGQLPSLPAVSAKGGTGSAQVALYKAGGYPVLGRLGDSLRSTAQVTVLPGGARSFEWAVKSPLVVSLPVDSPFTLTALDAYRNRVHHYAQIGTQVTLSASTGDSVAPRLLAPADFAAGQVDLHARKFTYFGSGGGVSFAAAAGQATGSSPPLEAQALSAESLSLGLGTVRRGVDTLTGSVRLRLLGAGSVSVTGLELVTSRGSYALSLVQPSLPAHLTGPLVIDLAFRWPVPAGLALGPLDVTCRVQAQYPVGSMVGVCPDTVEVSVVRASAPAVLSLVPASVAYDDVLYLATLTNSGGSGVSFQLDSSYLVFGSGVRRDTAKAALSGIAYLGPDDTLQLEYGVRHASGMAGDTAFPHWHVHGSELGLPVAHVVPAPSRVSFTTPARLAYLAGSQSPDTVVVGAADTLRFRIRNAGGTSVSGSDAQLELAGTADTIRASVARSLTPFAAWLPGDTTLAFALSQAQLQIAPGWYRTRISVSGQHNRIDTLFATGVADSLYVVGPPALRIDSLWLTAPQRTRVSTGQSCTLMVEVTNVGEDVVDSVRLGLVRDGVAQPIDTIFIPSILLEAKRQAMWKFVADLEPNPLVTYQAELVYGVGRVTRQRVVLSAAGRNFCAVEIQKASELQVQTRLYSPDDALDGRIAAGSPFEVAARFVNLGDGDISGAGLTIRTTGGLSVTGPADTITPPVNVDAVWSLHAPNADTTALIIVQFAGDPQDLNTGGDAQVSKSADTLQVRIVFEAPPLRVVDVQTAGGAVDGPYEPMAWTWTNSDPTGLFPILVKNLVVEATAADGVTLLDAASLVESAQLELGSDTVPAVISGGELRFGTDSLARVAPGSQGPVHLRIVPRLSGALTEFRWVTRSSIWTAVERSVGGAGLSVPVLDERGVSLFIESDLAFVPGREVANYPNPFKAGSEVTHIQYDLEAASQVEIEIFSASGQEVWNYQASAGTTGGQSGPNTVDWDGRNGRGDLVMDGVYFARVRSPEGEATLKIVVMK